MTDELEFRTSARCSMGVEIELQILNPRDYNLARDAADLVRDLGSRGLEEERHVGSAVNRRPHLERSQVVEGDVLAH